MTPFRFAGRALAVAAVAVAIAAPAAAQQQTVLKAVMHAPLRILDPVVTTAAITVAHSYLVYDQLLGMDEKLQPKPQMVDSWTISDDRLTYRFVLRDGLKFSNGQPVTAEDAVASINRWRQRDTLAQTMNKSLKSVNVVDDKTFEILLSEPFEFVLYALSKIASNLLMVMPKKVAESTPHTETIKDYTGSGPFIFKEDEFRPGVKAVYVRNPHYKPRDDAPSWTSGRKEAKVDRIELQVLPDTMTAVNALINGEVDFIESVPADMAPLLDGQEGLTLKVNNPLGWQGHLRMNHLHPPFDNVKIRRALLMAINQEDFMRAQVGDPKLYKVCYSFFICGTPMANDAGTQGLMRGDIEGARKLLKEAGYDGTKVVILQPTDYPETTPYGPITAQALRAIGMNVDMQVMDWNALVTRRTKMDPPDQGGWNIMHSNWSAFTAHNPMTNQPLNGGGRKGAWFGWPEDARIDELRAMFGRERDEAKRLEIAKEMQQRGYDLGFYAPLGEYFPRIAYRDYVKGIPAGSGTWFWNVSLEKKK